MSTRFGRILVAVDGSAPSHAAAVLAAELAHTYAAELIVVHVVEEDVAEELRRLSGKSAAEAQEALSEEGRRLLQEMEKIAQEHWLTVVSLLRHGIAHELLVDLAREKHVDLIVMGKVGRRGARRVLMGSVTQRVIDLSEAPVLVVK